MHRALVLLIAALLAGCSDGGSAKDAADDEFEEVETTAETGSISGVVVDATIRPVADATVTIVGQGLEAKTDAGGRFSFANLDPGLYAIQVNATGFLAIQSTTQVQAATVSKVRVVLPADPTPQPYHNTLVFNWFDPVGIVLVDFLVDLADGAFLGDSLPNQCENCYFDFESDGPVETFVIEADWQEQISDPTGSNSFYWNLAAQDDWTDYQDGYFEAREPAYIGDNRWGGLTSFTVSMYADETWVTVDQDAEIFVTMFYGTPAPEGWSFTAGDP